MIGEEAPPYNFNILLFAHEEKTWTRELEAEMKAELLDVLKKYNVENLDFRFDNGSKGKHNDKKLKIYFSIQEQKLALGCYAEVSSYKRSRPLGTTQCFPLIHFSKDEATFVKYGDIAAAKYYAEQERKNQEKQ